jgi:hypothetical protein
VGILDLTLGSWVEQPRGMVVLPVWELLWWTGQILRSKSTVLFEIPIGIHLVMFSRWIYLSPPGKVSVPET